MKILIASAEPVSRVLLECSIRAAGGEPVSTRSGKEIMELQKLPGAPRMAIIDRRLPEGDALAVVREMRAAPRGQDTWIAVLLPAGAKVEEAIAQVRAAGAEEALGRPIDREAIQGWMSRGQVALAGRKSDPCAGNVGNTPGDLVGRTIDDKYQILGVLGSGGMGTVYRARHLLVDEVLAFKVIHGDLASRPGFRQRFVREAKTMLRVVHRNAIAVRDCGVTGEGLLYLTMDLSHGRTLREQLAADGGRLPEARASKIARQISSVLAEAEACGVVHRDLKPDNVIMESGDVVKVCDFGLAKLLDDPEGDELLTRTGMVIGTPYYMPPEQAAGKELDGKADVYALGCILYELLAGTPPFQGRGPYQLIHAHQTQAPPPLKQRGVSVMPRLETLIMRMLAKNPVDRPTAAEVTAALDGQAARPAPEKSLRILLAEDSAVNRVLLRGMLRGWGHEVVLASDGEEALALVKDPAARFDAMLLDGEMPRLDGAGAAARIRELEKAWRRRTPILGMTSSEGRVDRDRCLAAGMDEVVSKPIRPEELAAALERLTLVALPGQAGEDSEVFDRRAALARVEGDDELLRETLTLLLDDMTRIVKALRVAEGRKDADALARAAHELKGAAGNCGAVALARAAARVESLAKTGQAERSSAEIGALEREVQRAVPVLQRASTPLSCAG